MERKVVLLDVGKGSKMNEEGYLKQEEDGTDKESRRVKRKEEEEEEEEEEEMENDERMRWRKRRRDDATRMTGRNEGI
ncbi:hypothetical protein Pmani_008687 [Petrolisthes manimaculis]|uniref:Uncharacterized protein n=1 Tax=Petrolisthes manimaculis TaxID=1843537 RepID=A0AAE1Q5S8_9EUCA|nr:hypothetical protein Pmani_008687 [Petrolisthes manimaculis]